MTNKASCPLKAKDFICYCSVRVLVMISVKGTLFLNNMAGISICESINIIVLPKDFLQ